LLVENGMRTFGRGRPPDVDRRRKQAKGGMLSARSLFAAALWLLAVFLGTPTRSTGQAIAGSQVVGGVPARFQPGDTLALTFRYDVPDSVGTASVRVVLLSRGDMVGLVRRIRPVQARGSGQGEAQHIFTEPVVADGIRIVLSGSRGFLQQTEFPIGVASLRPELRRPGWTDPRQARGPGERVGDRASGAEPDPPVGLLSVVMTDPRMAVRALAAARWDTISADEAARVAPRAVNLLTERLALDRVRAGGRPLLERARPGAERLERVDRPPAEAPPTPPLPEAAADTAGTPGPWTIEPDGSMRRTLADGRLETLDPSGQRTICEPGSNPNEFQCVRMVFAQIPRVIPSSELATIDVAWLESMDAWLGEMADGALAEMRALVANEASIQNYLGLEEGENIYQRLDRRLAFLGRLIN
jgi:hypothetical protein